MLSRHFNPEFNQGIFWRYMYNIVGHRGDILGATSFAYFDKNLDMGFIVFANSAGGKDIEKELNQITNLLWLYMIKFYKQTNSDKKYDAISQSYNHLIFKTHKDDIEGHKHERPTIISNISSQLKKIASAFDLRKDYFFIKTAPVSSSKH